MINGQTISSAANFTGTITAAVTPTNLSTGYIPYKSSTTLVNSNIYFDGTNVGIGTTSPNQKLDVNGIAVFNNAGSNQVPGGGIRITAPIAATHYNWMIGGQQNVDGGLEITPSTATGGTTFSTPTAVFMRTGDVRLGSGADTRGTVTIRNNGSSYSSGDPTDSRRGLSIIQNTPGAANILTLRNIVNSKFIDILEQNGSLSFNEYGNPTYDTRMYIQSGGNVGIGTTTPNKLLEVADTGVVDREGVLTSRETHNVGFGVDRTGSLWGMGLYVDGVKKMLIDSNAGVGIGGASYSSGNPPANGLIVEGNVGGNVGIGTNDPLGYKLYNNGTLYNNGNATVAGNIIGSGNYSVYNNFTSGWAGSGYRLDYGVTQASSSNLELDNLTVRKSMSVYELLIRQIKAVNGNLFVSSSAKCVSATSTSITFTDPTGHNILPFAAGDLLAAQRLALDGTLQSSLKLEYVEFIVTSVSGLTVTGTWNIAPVSYSDVVGYDFVRKGNNTDATRQGSIYLAADDNSSPFIDIIDGIASFSDWGSSSKLKARLGKLSGVTDNTYGQLSGYGLYSQNAYMTGNVNISGTLTAGDANGFGNTFYAGKIKKNLVQYSNSFTNWSYTVNTLTSGQTGPGGSSDAWLVSRPDAGDDYVTIIPSNYTSLSGKTVTFSIYAKANTANQIQLFIFDDDGTGYLSTNQIFTLQTTWQRYYITRMIRTGTLTAVHVRFYVINSTYPSAIYVADAQLELGSIPTPYQPTDGTLSSSTGYGMWSIAGGFGGTMQNPVVSLNDAGLYVKAAGHTANVLGNGTYIGNWTSTTGFSGTILNETGLSGYQNNSKVFYLDNTGAKIANFNISTDNISTGAFNTLNTLYFGSSGLSLSNTFSVTPAGALTATSGNIAGWNFNNTQFSSSNLSGGSDGNYTTAGIAINSAGWISAPNFALGNTVSKITDFTFGGGRLYNGDAATANAVYVGLSNAAGNNGLSYWNSSHVYTQGLNLFLRHQNTLNATSLVVGQLLSDINGLPSGSAYNGWWGIQMASVFSSAFKEYFTLGVKLSDSSVRNKISGFNFDETKLYIGNTRLEGSTSFKGLGISDGTDDIIKVGDFTWTNPTGGQVDNASTYLDNYNFASNIAAGSAVSDISDTNFYYHITGGTTSPTTSVLSNELTINTYNVNWILSGSKYNSTNGNVYVEQYFNSASNLAGKDIILGFDFKMGNNGSNSSCQKNLYFEIIMNGTTQTYYYDRVISWTAKTIPISVPTGTTSIMVRWRFEQQIIQNGLDDPWVWESCSLRNIHVFIYTKTFVGLNNEGLRIYRSQQEQINLTGSNEFLITTPKLTIGIWKLSVNASGDLVATNTISGTVRTVAAH